jgi:hypothetical protein
MADTREAINGWRKRAEEVRTLAERFVIPSHQETLRRVAASYERLASDAEARLARKHAATDKAE